MLNGASQEIAFSILDTNLKYEADNKSYLIDLINPNSEFENPKSIFLFKPHTEEVNKEAVNIEYYQNHTVTINGDATLFNVDGIKDAGFTLSYYDPVEHMVKVNAEIVPASFANHKVKFSAKLENLVMGRKYSYCAYTYDGLYYNYGEPCSFTIEAPTDIPAEAIDLGLPSGTKWASYNVGATKEEEYGDYYSWGETVVPRDNKYYFTTYSLCDGTVSSCHDIGDNISGTQYDVAHVKWGGEWCMPTKDDFKELVYNCEYKETTLHGVKGMQFTGPNGKYIFLPYSGYCWDTENSKAGTEGSYWSATQTTSVNKAHEMNFSKDQMLWDCYINRFAGLTVRPVIHSAPTDETSITFQSAEILEVSPEPKYNGDGEYLFTWYTTKFKYVIKIDGADMIDYIQPIIYDNGTWAYNGGKSRVPGNGMYSVTTSMSYDNDANMNWATGYLIALKDGTTIYSTNILQFGGTPESPTVIVSASTPKLSKPKKMKKSSESAGSKPTFGNMGLEKLR